MVCGVSFISYDTLLLTYGATCALAASAEANALSSSSKLAVTPERGGLFLAGRGSRSANRLRQNGLAYENYFSAESWRVARSFPSWFGPTPCDARVQAATDHLFPNHN